MIDLFKGDVTLKCKLLKDLNFDVNSSYLYRPSH